MDGSITIIALETTPREFTSVLRHLSTRDSKLNAKFRFDEVTTIKRDPSFFACLYSVDEKKYYFYKTNPSFQEGRKRSGYLLSTLPRLYSTNSTAVALWSENYQRYYFHSDGRNSRANLSHKLIVFARNRFLTLKNIFKNRNETSRNVYFSLPFILSIKFFPTFRKSWFFFL